MRTDERGGASLFVLVVLLFAALATVGISRVGAAASARAKAQGAADAAALAGVTGGADAAEALATANGAIVVRYDEEEPDVEVTVERDGVRAVARARGVPPAIP